MDWLRYKKIYYIFSCVLIVMGILSLAKWGLQKGVDFTGGSQIEYKFSKTIDQENLSKLISSQEIDVYSVQTIGNDTYIVRTREISTAKKDELTNYLAKELDEKIIFNKFETVGPSIGSELIRKTFYGAIIASVLILMWIAYQFKSIPFGVSAILAMFHDTFILVGVFALFGHFFSVEVDFLIVTAILTTLSFSVHDTIVVFDRIREIHNREGGVLDSIANRAITETMVRSLNNSFTIIFMLTALALLGGATIKWFAIALLIGTVLGTYSSPFVAVPLLLYIHKLFAKVQRS